MIKAKKPTDEAQRLQDLISYDVLDTSSEQCYDDLTAIAASICDTPIALVSLIDGDRQWFKSKTGLVAKETARDISFCGHAIHQQTLFTVPNATADERFFDNPFVTGPLGLRFYAGAPLISKNGHALGTLCVIDNKPKDLTPAQAKALEALARQVTHLFELRKASSEVRQQNLNLKKYAALVARQEAQLVQSAKMTSLGEMAAGVAHEINNPLAIIVGRADRIARLEKDPHIEWSKLQPEVLKIKETANRIARIVKGLRTFSRNADDDPFYRVNVKTLVDETLALCQEKFKNNNVELKVENDLDVELECSHTQISQVLINLLNNSYDAIEELPEKWVHLQIKALEGGRLQLVVTDSGSGIPEEIAKKIMEPFFTTKKFGKGTGLGLSMSVGIAHLHQGSLTLDQGATHTRFVLDIPLRQAISIAS